MDFSFQDKIVLITGGSKGIGLACVLELLRNGVKGITIASSNPQNGKAALEQITKQFGPGRATFVTTDVSIPSELENAFKTTITTWKTLDIVINNSAVMDDQQWEQEIAINCNAVVQGTLLGLKYMRKDQRGKGGTIINMSSILGFLAIAGNPVYIGTKHFVIGFSRSMGLPYHFDKSGVRIIALGPGRTDTELISGASVKCLTELGSNIGTQLNAEFDSVSMQTVEDVGRGLITVLKNGESGSCWIVEGGEDSYELDIPLYPNMRRKV